MSAVANFTTRHGFCSILGKNAAFCVYSVHVKYWCAANSNLAYFIELTTALECQNQLLMSSISNLVCRESLEIAVTLCSNCHAHSTSYFVNRYNESGTSRLLINKTQQLISNRSAFNLRNFNIVTYCFNGLFIFFV